MYVVSCILFCVYCLVYACLCILFLFVSVCKVDIYVCLGGDVDAVAAASLSMQLLLQLPSLLLSSLCHTMTSV